MTFKQITTVIILVMVIVFNCNAQSDKFHHPDKFIQQQKKEKNPGKKIYQAYCENCHAKEPLIQVQAPKFRHLADWQLRLKQTDKLLFKHVDEGINTMPPRGGCFECSDKALLAAIKYMLPQP